MNNSSSMMGGGIGGGGGMPVDLCTSCASNERRLADAQLQIDTLANRQAVLDAKLSSERQRYEVLQTKYNTLLQKQEEFAMSDQKRQALSATVKKLQDQLVETQVANENLEERIEEMKITEDNLRTELATARQKSLEVERKNEALHDTMTNVQHKLTAANAKIIVTNEEQE
jgi:chromosome segregation ATPase